VEADQCDVSPVQGGGKGKLAARSVTRAGEHLLGQHCAYRMRNGVVHMQQVERVDLCHFRHASGQSKIVWRIFEERILRDVHFMEVNVGVEFNQSNRLGVRNEMDLVAALRQLNTQFSGDHSAATIGWITGYPDL